MERESWIDLTKKAFIFASNSGKAFCSGNAEVKRIILIGMGLNWTILDHKLTIQAQEWLIPFINPVAHDNAQKEPFEPAKIGLFTNKTDLDGSACLVMRGQGDLNP